MHLASLVLIGNKNTEGSTTGMLKYELASVSDKMNLKL